MPEMSSERGETVEVVVEEGEGGLRLDVFLAERIEDASRSFIQKVIKDGRVRVNGQACTRPSRHTDVGDAVRVELPPPTPATLEPEDIPLDILYEDADILVINKPSGLVVHPAPGHYTGTLVHAVLFHCPDFQKPSGDDSGVIRPGIVHRLDRFTSGVMVVAKTQRAYNSLAKQAREHAFDRRYLALVQGEFKEDSGRIDASIGRSLGRRGKMAVTSVKSREAITRFEVKERFGVASLIALTLETGRTHQIRVHLRFAGRPVLGDPVYGVTDYQNWPVSNDVRKALEGLEGQALHAELLGLEHPTTGKRMMFCAPPPADFLRALQALREFISRPEGQKGHKERT